MVKREDVEALLADLEKIRTPNRGLFAECCRAWLALDAAPEVEWYGYESQFEDWRQLTGQVVRLVATSGGDREDR